MLERNCGPRLGPFYLETRTAPGNKSAKSPPLDASQGCDKLIDNMTASGVLAHGYKPPCLFHSYSCYDLRHPSIGLGLH